MDSLAAVLEKLAEGDKFDKAIGVLESAASKSLPIASHSRDTNRDDKIEDKILPGNVTNTTKLLKVT